MAELAFKIKADYEEAIRLREELRRLTEQMDKADTSTQNGKVAFDELNRQYDVTRGKLSHLVEGAAEAAYYMGDGFRTKVASARKELAGLVEQLHQAQVNLEYAKQNYADSPELLKTAEERVGELSAQVVDAQKSYEGLNAQMKRTSSITAENAGVLEKLVGGSKTFHNIVRFLPGPLKQVAAGLNSISTAAINFIKSPLGLTLAGVAAGLKTVSLWLNKTASGGYAKFKMAETFEKWSIAITGTSKKLKALEEATRSGATSTLLVYKKLQNQWAAANGELEKQRKILASDDWKKLGLSVNSINDAESILVANSEQVVKAFIARAKAAALYKQAEKDVEDYLNQENKTAKANDRDKDEAEKAQEKIKALREGNERLEKQVRSEVQYDRNGQRRTVSQLVTHSDERGQYYVQPLTNKKIYAPDENEVGSRGKFGPTALQEWYSDREKYAEQIAGIIQANELEIAQAEAKIQGKESAINTRNEKLQEFESKITDTLSQSLRFDDEERGILEGLGIYSNTSEDNAEKARENYYELLRKRRQEESQKTIELGLSLRQAEIDSMKEGSAKTLAQMKLDKDKELAAIDQWYIDIREEKMRKAKEDFEANPENAGKVFHYNINSYGYTQQENDVYQGKRAAVESNYNLNLAVFNSEQDDKWNEYLMKYGSFENKRVAIKKEAEDKLLALSLREAQRGEEEAIRKQEELDLLKVDIDEKQLAYETSTREGNYQRQKVALAELKDALIAEAKARNDVAAIAQLEQEKKEGLLEIDVTEARHNKMIAEKAMGYDGEKMALDNLYVALIKAAEAKNDLIEVTRLENEYVAKSIALDEKYDASLRMVFGSLQNYTKAQLAAAKQKAREMMATEGISAEDIERYQRAINAITEAEFKLENSFSATGRGNDSSFGGLTSNLKNLSLLRKQLAEQTKDVDKQLIQADIDNLTEQIKSDLPFVSVNLFTQGLMKAADAMKELAEASGDSRLAESANNISTLGSGISSVLQGALIGGPIGAAISAVTFGLEEIYKEWVSCAVQTRKAAKEVEAYEHALKLASLTVKETDFSSIFGTNQSGLMSEYAKKSVDGLRAYREEMDKLNNADYAPEQYTKWWQGLGLGMPVGGAGLLIAGLVKETTKGYEAYQDAIERGQRGLQTMMIKTLNRGGFAEFFGAQDEYKSLGDLAPDIFGEDGMLDVDQAKLFLETNTQITDEQRKQIQNAIDLNEKYKEAEDGLKGMLSGIFGNTSSTLADATIAGLTTGATLGGEKMKYILGGTIADLQKQMVQGIYARYLSSYEDEALQLIKGGGNEEDLVSLYGRMIDEMGPAVEIASNAARSIQALAESRGFHLGMNNVDASRGSYQQISEVTGSSIEGRMTAIQMMEADERVQLGLMGEDLSRMINLQSRQVGIAEEIRQIQVDSYLALVAIKENTDTSTNGVKTILETVQSMDRTLRDKL